MTRSVSAPLWPGAASLVAREAALLAPYAMHSTHSAGRQHPEPPHPYRGPFQRDRDRIVHRQAAYRRLSYKTQVFTGERGDYHRTRLTHTLEVASIARTMARALRLNEDLVEALALLHDIGHPPFGHCGEDILDECLKEHGGFSHNRQALRIVQLLERRYHQFPGINLSTEVLAGQTNRTNKNQAAGAESPLLEVQVVDAADSIAYDTHDADDAMELHLLTLDELLEIPLWQEAAERVKERNSPLTPAELRLGILHELIEWQVGELLEHVGQELATGKYPNTQAVRQAAPLVQPSTELASKKRELEAFLFDKVYRHPTVVAERDEAGRALRAMYTGYLHRPDLLPTKFQQLARQENLPRSIADYIGGMTDRYALQEYERLFK